MSEITPTQQSIATKLDDMLLDILNNGQEVVIEGTALRIKPSPAMLNVIAKRVKDLGVDSVSGLNENTPAERLKSRVLKLQGEGKLPPLSDDDDAATSEAA